VPSRDLRCRPFVVHRQPMRVRPWLLLQTRTML
jgi:hypothetical protein